MVTNKKSNRVRTKINLMAITRLIGSRQKIMTQNHNNLKGGRDTSTEKLHIPKKDQMAMTVAKEAAITDPINSNIIETTAILSHLTDLATIVSFTAATKISEIRGTPNDFSCPIFQSPSPIDCKIYYNTDVQERSHPRRAGMAQGSIHLSLRRIQSTISGTLATI
jgi:hypothetical protein